MDSATIRQGELIGQGLMAYETTEEVGSVEHLLVDVSQARVVGLSCKVSGLIGRKLAFDWSQLVKIGGDRIIIQTEVSESVDSPLSAAQDITDLEVWTDGGDHIGRVVDVCFDQSTGEVQHYLYLLKVKAVAVEDSPTAELFGEERGDEEGEGGDEEEIESLIDAAVDSVSDDDSETVIVYKILPGAIISAGRKRMMVAEEDAKRAQPYEQRLNLSAKKTEIGLRTEWRPEKMPEIPTDFNELLQKGQSFAEQVTDRVRSQAKRLADEQLRDREFGEAGTLPDITEQLQERTEQVKEQMQQRLEKARRLAQEKTQEQLEKRGLEKKLGGTAFGRSIGKQLGRFAKKDKVEDPIDVESFEVWEDD